MAPTEELEVLGLSAEDEEGPRVSVNVLADEVQQAAGADTVADVIAEEAGEKVAEEATALRVELGEKATAAGEERGMSAPPRMTSIAMVVPALLLFGIGGKGRVVREEEE